MVLGVLDTKLDAGITENHIARTHRLGRKRGEGKPRPIIVKFISYREREKAFDSKRKLKSQKIISENLTEKRYSLLQKCIEEFGSIDGRITCITGVGKKVFERIEDLTEFLVLIHVVTLLENTISPLVRMKTKRRVKLSA